MHSDINWVVDDVVVRGYILHDSADRNQYNSINLLTLCISNIWIDDFTLAKVKLLQS